ncbi:unnamed protein product [Ilex paraguariensis]|uniref:Thioredoxin domain-containing protein n=1 Tax=Ilex paraguariensis TaxID=185542 RepID=A0ABC8U742_9AQUA
MTVFLAFKNAVPMVTDETWQSLVLQADGPVLVEFWAPWCGPCCMLHPVIGELSKQYAGKLKCFKMNTDDSFSIATQYGIRKVSGCLHKTSVSYTSDRFLSGKTKFQAKKVCDDCRFGIIIVDVYIHVCITTIH